MMRCSQMRFLIPGIARVRLADAARGLSVGTGPTRFSRRFLATTDDDATRIPLRSWLNPWADLAKIATPEDLTRRVSGWTQLWGVLSALMCSSAVAALLGFPHEKKTPKEEEEEGRQPSPLLAQFLSRGQMHDAYIGTCVSSFFMGGVVLGFSAIGSSIAFVLPVESINVYVMRHSLMLGSMPALTVVSGGLLGLSIVIGVDLEYGAGDLGVLAMGCYALTTALVGFNTVKSHTTLVRSIARASAKAKKGPSAPLVPSKPLGTASKTKQTSI